MRLLVSSILGCLGLAAAHAAEIAAWKVDLHDLKGHGADIDRLEVLKSPPEKTVFFKEGDQLRGFSKEQIKQHLPTEPALEWAVWNETTGRRAFTRCAGGTRCW